MAIKNFRERSAVLIGILSILGISGGTFLAFSLDKLPFVKQAYEVKAEFADAAGLTVENQVRVAGVKVGTVSDISLAGDRVLVTLEIDNDAEIPEDAGAHIKLATLLGTKFVEIDGAGGAPYLEAGDTIPLERTTVPYEIYQAANQGTAVLEGIRGPLLNRSIAELAQLVTKSRKGLGKALEGLNELAGDINARDDELLSLLRGADDLTKLLAEEGDEIVRLIDASNEVLGSLSEKREDIESLLTSTKFMADELTTLIRQNRKNIDPILQDLHDALVVLERNVEHLDVAFAYAGPSSKYFARVFQQGPWGDIYTCVLILTSICESDE